MQQVSILGFKTFRTPSLCCGAKSPETLFMLPSSRTPGNLLALKELHPEVAARHIVGVLVSCQLYFKSFIGVKDYMGASCGGAALATLYPLSRRAASRWA